MKYGNSKTFYAHYTLIHELCASTFTCICAGWIVAEPTWIHGVTMT
jgi:hypothetical protein